MIKLSQVAKMLVLPGAARAAVRWRPFSVTAFQMMRALKGECPRLSTILDGGANVGQFTRAATETYPDALIVAFEALPDIAERLRTNLRDREQVRVIHTALGSSSGILTFHRNEYSLASSALPMLPDASEKFPGLRESGLVDVPVEPLDALIEHNVLEPPVLLKLDLQGFELEALRGASNTLSMTDFVLLEMGYMPSYEGEPTFDEVYSFMRMSGFRLRRPLDVLRSADGRIAQMDVLFDREVS